MQIIDWFTLPGVPIVLFSTSTVIPSFLSKKSYLLHILVVMSLEHFIAEKIFLKQPINIKFTTSSVSPFQWLVNILEKQFIYLSTSMLMFWIEAAYGKGVNVLILVVVLSKLISCHPQKNTKIKLYLKI